MTLQLSQIANKEKCHQERVLNCWAHWLGSRIITMMHSAATKVQNLRISFPKENNYSSLLASHDIGAIRHHIDTSQNWYFSRLEYTANNVIQELRALFYERMIIDVSFVYHQTGFPLKQLFVNDILIYVSSNVCQSTCSCTLPFVVSATFLNSFTGIKHLLKCAHRIIIKKRKGRLL